ncbi:taste receptor type 2 member 40-like [Hyperolius riggenbachi]|uniref:taste receptor type 2 member 40-like n=1 Tax=Hyperolius riggenbachi TaxID=752182 RepID=UPI0035A306EA
MAVLLTIFRVIQVIVTYSFGVFMNVKIAVAYLEELKQNIQANVLDQILLSMAITNIILQNFLTLDHVLHAFDFYVLLVEEWHMFIFVSIISLIEYSFWHTSWLSMYYFLKLVKSSNPFFLWMKARFFSFVGFILLWTAIGSIAINLPFAWMIHIDFLHNMTNPTINNYEIEMSLAYTMFDIMLGCCLPFLLSCVALGLSVTYLLQHVFRVKGNESQFSGPQLNGLIGAVKIMITHLVSHLTFALIIAGSLTSEFSVGVNWDVVFWALISFYPSVQSVILILGNTKLKSKLCCGRCK